MVRPLTVVPEHWGKGVDEYLHMTHSLTDGDGSTPRQGGLPQLFGFAFLALTTIFCYLVLLPATSVARTGSSRSSAASRSWS